VNLFPEFHLKSRVFLPAILSGVLLWTAFFPLNWWGVAFVAMAPFLTLVRAEGIGRWRRYTAAWLGGLTFGGLAVNWLRHADPMMMYFAWPGVALFLSLWWPLALFLLRRLDRFGRPPLALTFPVVWVALEYCKAHFPTGYPFMKWIGLYFPSGFPWYFLGHTQHANAPLLQSADLGGVYLISAAVGVANGAAHDLLVRVRLVRWLVNLPRGWQMPVFRAELMSAAGAVLVVGVLIVYGCIRLVHEPFQRGPTVAVLQDDIEHSRLMSDWRLVFARYDAMTRAAAKSNPTPDLIVWPEACYPFRDITLKANSAEEREAMIRALPDEGMLPYYLAVQETSEKRPLFNLAEVDADQRADAEMRKEELLKLPPNLRSKFDASGYFDLIRSGQKEHARTRWQRDPANPQTSVLLGGEAVDWDGTTEKRYNSARLILPDGTHGPRYDKTHLVPFGEYIPFREQMPFLASISPALSTPRCEPGQSFTRFPIRSARDDAENKGKGKQYTFGVLICYEDTDPTIARRYNPWSGEPNPADFLVNQSLDSWFGTSEELDQHLAISRFRAVEARRPLVRSVNMGLSAVIDGDGQIVEMAGLPEDGWEGSKGVSRALVVDIPLDGRASVYAAVGDWVPLMCWVGILSGLVTLRLARRRAKAKTTAPTPAV
jgi:apolipoprotein N-acyltransferase